MLTRSFSGRQPSDVSGTLSLLRDCARFYHTGRLQPDCSSRPCRGVPDRCGSHDAVYHLMHYVLDTGFLPPQVPADRVSQLPAGRVRSPVSPLLAPSLAVAGSGDPRGSETFRWYRPAGICDTLETINCY